MCREIICCCAVLSFPNILPLLTASPLLRTIRSFRVPSIYLQLFIIRRGWCSQYRLHHCDAGIGALAFIFRVDALFGLSNRVLLPKRHILRVTISLSNCGDKILDNINFSVYSYSFRHEILDLNLSLQLKNLRQHLSQNSFDKSLLIGILGQFVSYNLLCNDLRAVKEQKVDNGYGGR